MSLSFEIYGSQIDGKREYQEDAFLITHLVGKEGQPCSLMIVADGMGGHAAGNIASNMAVQSFSKHVTVHYPSDNIAQVLHEGIMRANHSITEMVKETPALEGMGCTIVGVLLQDNQIWWASVGDSHLFLLRNREISKLNADHSYGGFLDAMQAAGTPVEPEAGLSRNMLMSAVTGGDLSEIDCPSNPLRIQAGDKILICSDGVNTLSNGKIIQYCDWSDSPKECVDSLLTAVENENMPKQDNTTAIVVYVVDKAALSAPPPAATKAADDEDITSPSIFKKPAVAAGNEIQAPPEPQVPPAVRQAAAEDKPKPQKTFIMVLAAGIIIAAGIGAFFKFGGFKPASAPTPAVVTSQPNEQAPVAKPDIATGTESGPVTGREKAPEEAAESATANSTETAPAEKTVTKPESKTESVTGEPAKATTPVETTEIKTVTAPQKIASAAMKELQDTLKDGSKGPKMVWIPAGSFAMGSPGTSTSKDERPRHNVKINKFAISKYEITIAEYERYAMATKRPLPDDLYMEHDTSPVVLVKWDDAFTYAKWLSEQTGQKYRLPSEAEWEFAASGGQDTPFWWGYEEKPGMAHCFTCESQLDPRKPSKIGKFPSNPFGIFDTAGNVSEWVYDCWHDTYVDAPTDGSVWEGGDCSQRIARGGSYISPQQSVRIAKRDKFKSDSGYDHVGIRLARDE